MYIGWKLVLTFVIALLSGESLGIWPFHSFSQFSVHATTDVLEPQYADPLAKRIAIIGAGAAGSSTAYYLRQFAAESGVPINVTIFERSSYVGGRSTTVNAYGNALEPVELGASIFVDINTILKNSSEKFGLRPRDSETENSEVLGIWNGETFVFTQADSEWAWWKTAKILWKYGLAPVRTQRLMKSTINSFLKLYESPYFPFRSLSERSEFLGLTAIASLTGEQYLAANKIGSPFSTDIIQASTRVNYGQNLGLIHGLETMVCMAIDGAKQILGGNWQIFDNMVKASNATILLNNTVNGISKHQGKYAIKSSSLNTSSGETIFNEEPFDTVVLAAPLQFTAIELEDKLLRYTPDKIPYVKLHVTLFSSPRTLNPIYFNLAPDAQVPNSILTTLPPTLVPKNPEDGVGPTGFFSISTLRTIINPKTLEIENLYKIFSPREVTSDFLSGILGAPVPEDLSSITADGGDAITWYYPHVWYSYPYEYPRVTFEEIQLARGFYYTSGMESFISTMETMALMGMNVAQLIVDDYVQLLEQEGGLEEPTQKVLSELTPQEL
ncbi:hypothetical protein B7494_g1796 [Chlorociboria aeruginascens]|nr:hypothetical protein B7494_g1796 [Chlorociboria aeruginascens]